MLVLLPPSEGKTAPRRGRPLDLGSLSTGALTDARQQVLDALVELCTTAPDRACRVLGLPETRSDLVDLDARLASAPTARADRIYSGVLYEALDLPTLSPGAKRRAASRVLVTSSLFGLVGPGDRIPAYRLAGDVVLPGLGSVAGHWRGHLGAALTDRLGRGLLVDLRSTTYAAFWRPTLGARVASVRVLHEGGGRRAVVSHFNKATKGRLLRGLLESGADPRTPGALATVLRDLGWTVEIGEPSGRGAQLDVVVHNL